MTQHYDDSDSVQAKFFGGSNDGLTLTLKERLPYIRLPKLPVYTAKSFSEAGDPYKFETYKCETYERKGLDYYFVGE